MLLKYFKSFADIYKCCFCLFTFCSAIRWIVIRLIFYLEGCVVVNEWKANRWSVLIYHFSACPPGPLSRRCFHLRYSRIILSHRNKRRPTATEWFTLQYEHVLKWENNFHSFCLSYSTYMTIQCKCIMRLLYNIWKWLILFYNWLNLNKMEFKWI